MKMTKYTERGRLEKYISENAVITFAIGRDKIHVTKRKLREDLGYKNKSEYVGMLFRNGFINNRNGQSTAEYYQKAINTTNNKYLEKRLERMYDRKFGNTVKAGV